MKRVRTLASCVLALLAAPALAGDFDGSKPIICATQAAVDCVRGDDCVAGLPEEVGAPAFMRFDFAKKTVIGPKVTSDIMLLEKSAGQLLMQGREAGFGWTIAVDEASGEMIVSLANRSGAFVVYGSCTPL